MKRYKKYKNVIKKGDIELNLLSMHNTVFYVCSMKITIIEKVFVIMTYKVIQVITILKFH